MRSRFMRKLFSRLIKMSDSKLREIVVLQNQRKKKNVSSKNEKIISKKKKKNLSWHYEGILLSYKISTMTLFQRLVNVRKSDNK